MRWDVQFGRAIDDDGTERVIAILGRGYGCEQRHVKAV